LPKHFGFNALSDFTPCLGSHQRNVKLGFYCIICYPWLPIWVYIVAECSSA